MRINTVQTILFRQLRMLNEQHGAGSRPQPSASDGTKSSLPPRRARPGLIARIRRLCLALNGWLASHYQLCGRSGLESSPESRTILLRARQVVRLTRGSRAKHLEVRQGTVRFTGRPAQGDVLLHRGDRFDLKDNWPFVVEAIRNAEIILLS